jgi:hypothetical protein
VRLVEHIAREIYSDEVRRGAWVLDIALFGLGLFVPDVVFELKRRRRHLVEYREAGVTE